MWKNHGNLSWISYNLFETIASHKKCYVMISVPFYFLFNSSAKSALIYFFVSGNQINFNTIGIPIMFRISHLNIGKMQSNWHQEYGTTNGSLIFLFRGNRWVEWGKEFVRQSAASLPTDADDVDAISSGFSFLFIIDRFQKDYSGPSTKNLTKNF